MVRHAHRHECNPWVAEKGVFWGHCVTVGLCNFEQTPDANLLHYDIS
jgi:hypothetical protein